MAPKPYFGENGRARKNCAPVLLTAVCGLCTLLLAGCSGDDGSARGATEAAVESTGPAQADAGETIVATVDGDELKIKDIEAEIALRKAIARLRKRRLTEREENAIASRYSRVAAQAFIEERLLFYYAKEHKLAIPAEEREKYAFAVAKSCRKKSFEEVLKHLGENERRLIERDIDRVLTINTAKKDIKAQAKITIAPEDVEKARKSIDAANVRAAATNDLVFARATNVWKKISGGELTFAEAAADYTEIPQEMSGGGIWGAFDSAQLAATDEELAKHLENLAIGEFTPPIEADNGLCIIKLDAKKPAKGAGAFEYDLSRIFFRLAEWYETPTVEEMRDLMQKEAENAAVRRKLEELSRKHRITGPARNAAGGSRPPEGAGRRDE